jgi:hypothetical protein
VYGAAGGSLGGIVTALLAGVEPAITTAVPVVGGGGLADVAIRTENNSVLGAMMTRIMGPLVITAPSAGPGPDSACNAGDFSLQIMSTSLTARARTEFACLPPAEVAGDDLLIVRNLTNGEVSCAGSTGGVPGQFAVSVPSDAGDRWVVEHYRHGRDLIHFGECEFIGEAPAPDRVIETWESGNTPGCYSCGRYQGTTWETGAPLVATTAGFGRRRQTPDFRRLVMLAQIGLESGDPINYARRVILDPITAPDVAQQPRSMLVTNMTGDPNVMIATGYALARAAGIVPFLPPDAPEHLAEFRAPRSFEATHPGYATPNDWLLGHHVIEGLARLERHPVNGGGENFLVDPDDLSDGRLFFSPVDLSQAPSSEGGLRPVRGTPPLRWSRQTRPMASPGDESVFDYVAGEPTSGMVSPYSAPTGAHGFDLMFDDTIGFDAAVYMFNMIGRYMSTEGTDIPYLSDPTGHHCLEDSSCSYISE